PPSVPPFASTNRPVATARAKWLADGGSDGAFAMAVALAAITPLLTTFRLSGKDSVPPACILTPFAKAVAETSAYVPPDALALALARIRPVALLRMCDFADPVRSLSKCWTTPVASAKAYA